MPKTVLHKMQYPLMTEKHLSIIGTRRQIKQGLKSQIREMDINPEGQCFQNRSF